MIDWLDSILFGNGEITQVLGKSNMEFLLVILGGGLAIFGLIFFLAMGKSKPNAKPNNNQVKSTVK